ncbi:hypothetical protein Lal_00001790 [Lupinus albus]|nr:hypothetical protein Lal_00001790 [Lupinus albus]
MQYIAVMEVAAVKIQVRVSTHFGNMETNISNSSMFIDPKSLPEPPIVVMNSSNVSEYTEDCRVRLFTGAGVLHPPPLSEPPGSFPKPLKFI